MVHTGYRRPGKEQNSRHLILVYFVDIPIDGHPKLSLYYIIFIIMRK